MLAENCKECKPAIQCENLIIEIENMKKEISILQKDTGDLKTITALNKQLTDTVLNMLTEIKDSIKAIAAKLGDLEGKPGQRWEQAIRTIITTAVGAIITYIILKH